MSDKPSVLFVCVHNAGRSQMAAGWLRHLAGDAVEVRSAGSEPADQINPAAGCLPLLIQIPIFFGLYFAVRDLSREAGSFLWLENLNEPDPYKILPIMAGVFQTSSTPSVSVGPGATALTVIPYFAHSAPRLWVSTVAPALAAA